ncbi:hypothetical protein ACS0TY_001325 [Phlomoides rotata]
MLSSNNSRRVRRRIVYAQPYGMLSRIPDQVLHMSRLFLDSDVDCISNLRMDRNSFGRLCFLMRELGGLVDRRYISVEEQVSMFLSILAHHKKNRVIKFDFRRSGQTVSHYVHIVLRVVLSLHTLFLVKPTPVTDDSTDSRWKWFKGYLGALDGTYIDLHVPSCDKPRFRTRKGRISTNFTLTVILYRYKGLLNIGIGHFCPNCSPVMSENSLGPSSALVELSLQLNLSHSYKLSEA